MKKHGPALFCLMAGGGDVLTGLLLLAAPELALRLLGIPRPEGSLVLLRFVGVFVGCVGLSYFQPWISGRFYRVQRLAAALVMTAGFRLAVSLFLGVAVAENEMDLSWILVGIYDALLATVQLALLSRGFFDAV